MVKKRCHSTLS